MELYIGKLTEQNKVQFIVNLKENDVFTYSSSFDAKEVIRLGKSAGVEIEYCKPNSKNYKLYGSFTCKVVPTDAATTIDILKGALAEAIEALKTTRSLNLHLYEKDTVGNRAYKKIEQVLSKHK